MDLSDTYLFAEYSVTKKDISADDGLILPAGTIIYHAVQTELDSDNKTRKFTGKILGHHGFNRICNFAVSESDLDGMFADCSELNKISESCADKREKYIDFKIKTEFWYRLTLVAGICLAALTLILFLSRNSVVLPVNSGVAITFAIITGLCAVAFLAVLALRINNEMKFREYETESSFRIIRFAENHRLP